MFAGRKGKKRDRAHETAEQMIDRVMDAFARWLAKQTPGFHQNSEVLDVVRTACEFKSLYFEPNPADWPGDVVERVINVTPAKMIGVDAEFAAAVAPAMQVYLDFLVLTGRWKPHNDEQRSRAALARLGELPSRFGDRDRQSMAGRVMQQAVDEGIELSDPDALAGFMQRFDDLRMERRRRATDGSNGGLDDDLDALDDALIAEVMDPVRRGHREGIAAALDLLLPLASVPPGRDTPVTVAAGRGGMGRAGRDPHGRPRPEAGRMGRHRTRGDEHRRDASAGPPDLVRTMGIAAGRRQRPVDVRHRRYRPSLADRNRLRPHRSRRDQGRPR